MTSGAGSFGTTRVASGPRAGFWRRFASSFIDGLILGVINGVLRLVFKTGGVYLSILVDIAYYLYFIGGPTGMTPGMRLMDIRIIDFDTGGSIGYSRAVIRYFGAIVSLIPLGLGYFWMLWDPEKQCWHDKFANDVVVPSSSYPVSN